MIFTDYPNYHRDDVFIQNRSDDLLINECALAESYG